MRNTRMLQEMLMMRHVKTYLGVAIAALIAGAGVMPSQAAPSGTVVAAVGDVDAQIQQIHYRSSRYGVWRNGNRFWRGGDHDRYYRDDNYRYYRYDYGYYRRPGLTLRFGGGDWDGRRHRRYYD